MTIIEAVRTMTQYGFRRLPVTDPGTRKLRGIVTAGDIINLMGGGNKFNLVKKKHGGNLLAAINDSIRMIMTQQVSTVKTDARIKEAVAIITEKKIGGIPIVDGDGVLSGIITERDVMRVLATEHDLRPIERIMSSSLRVIDPDAPIGDATRDMVAHKFRRLPVVKDDVLMGIITATDILKYVGDGQVFQRMVTGDIAEVMSLPVRNLISSDMHTIGPMETVSDAACAMMQKNVGSLPVIEDTRLVGIVTEFDLVKAFAVE
jgi:CBS domain-containing protein